MLLKETELKAEIEQFKIAIAELEERYENLLEQSAIKAVRVPTTGSPEEILRAAMLAAETAARRETEQAGIQQAISAMKEAVAEKEWQLDQLLDQVSTKERAKAGLAQLHAIAEQVNQLSTLLETEIQNLQTVSQQISDDCHTAFGYYPLLFDAEVIKLLPYVVKADQGYTVVAIDEAHQGNYASI